MDLERLKIETAPDHDRVEGVMSVMSPDLDQLTYIATLQSLFGFIRGWERWAESVSLGYLSLELARRRRSALLATDLAFFSAPLPGKIYPGPNLSNENPAHVLGAMYVIEGSTLGGQYIARHVEQQLSLSGGQGNAYFHGYGERTGEMWRDVKALLESVPDDEANTVIHAAKTLFSDFATWNGNAEASWTKGTSNA